MNQNLHDKSHIQVGNTIENVSNDTDVITAYKEPETFEILEDILFEYML